MAAFAPEVLALLAGLGLDTTILKAGAGGVGEIDALVGLGRGVSFYVDGDNGLDTNDGKSWAKPFEHIQAAITASNALANWTWKKLNTIWIMPGDYAENLTGDILHVHIVGLGIRGTDTQVKICPAAGSVLAKGVAATCYLVGAHLANLRFQVNTGVPILDIEIAGGSLIEHCQFEPGASVAGIVGIDTEDCKYLTVRDCDFEMSVAKDLAYGIYHRGGLNKYAGNCRYINNKIFAYTAGIYFDSQCNTHQTVIQHNTIRVWDAAALAGIGIDDNFGQSHCIDNWIAALDGIHHVGGNAFLIANHIVETAGATGAVEADASD